MSKKIFTITGIAFLKLLSALPLPVLYLVSDLMYPVVYRLVRYRRKVVRMNLTNAFPGKSEEQLIETERDYYRNLCDIMVETIKTRGMTREELCERMHFRNPGLINNEFESGKSVVVIAAHMGNWEWLLHMPLFVRHQLFFVYKPLEDTLFDRYLNLVRQKYGGETVPMSLILKKLLDKKDSGTPVMTWLAADQTPPWNHPFWTMFLHQKTQFFNGPAKLAQRFDFPVFFQRVKRIRRGYYETWFESLTDKPREVSEEAIIHSYVRKIEGIIAETPEDYLWSHRRWKNSRHAPENFFANLPH